MQSSDPRTDPADLVSHAAYLRSLARGILSDDALAEDAVQEAFIQALRRPPGHGLGAWLARVTRNAALNIARGKRRALDRERRVARDEAVRIDAETSEQLELQGRLLEAVQELSEPYRSVVHLRYYRAWTTARIATELALPVKTVQSRLTRAHALLRERIDRTCGPREQWVALLWPVARQAASVPFAGALGGAVLMKKAVLLLVVSASVVGLWTLSERTLARPLDDRALPAGDHADASGALEPRSSAAPSNATALEQPSAAAVPRAPAGAVEVEPAVEGDATALARERTAVERMLSAIEASLVGPFEPGALLDGALLFAAHEVGTPSTELDFAGRLGIPLEDLPDGVEAELFVHKKNVRFETVRTLEVRFAAPRAPYVVGGHASDGVNVAFSTWTNDDGELLHFTILTGVDYTRLPDDPSFVDHMLLHTPLDAPSTWTLKATGMREVPGGLQADGGRKLESDRTELDPGLVIGTWPRVEDMRRLSGLLLGRTGSGR